MSSTTTTTTQNPTTLSLLSDYELHHSGHSESQTAVSPSIPSQSQPSSGTNSSNPPTWPTTHRRVPPHRPINRSLDFNERSAGASVPEYIFIQSMLHGVWLNASIAQLWRKTGGKINERWFRFDVGGEY
ncbi:uncharacterized protein BDV14DRAFT_204473 [Aspergillus stella-maris]|uniref:uncharacterized protein n=1 Tax=Aspergillus stella-maris TaxID=1810926 RepID=UPI003CCDA5E4